MTRKRLLLLLKPFDVFPKAKAGLSRVTNPKVLSYLDNRRKVHKDAINFCQDILQKKNVNWQPILRSHLSQAIRDVDLVVTVGGDGTLLQASHFLDDSVPVLGVNSDPTQAEEVEEFGPEFDATRSIGYLCAATVGNFEQMVDNILEGKTDPSKLSRMSICVNSKLLPKYALNDVLIVHPSPATVSRFSFRIKRDGHPGGHLVNCRSSGLRVSTAAGSTAATLSAGGTPMPILSKDLQYMVREPILHGAVNSSPLHGLVQPHEGLEISWFCKEGLLFTDGSHVFHSIQHGDTIELSSNAPILKVFLPNHLS
ncbi:NADH kinase-like [Diospyros lotus]|uniref:NADH kinase-like n=1 Tax=Diospyros lotus TaxID=55363 RepID=UPI0022544288|nr:NADH kinase-like [Diospyros lotus]